MNGLDHVGPPVDVLSDKLASCRLPLIVTEPRAVATGSFLFFISEFDKRPVATARGSVTNDKLKLIGHFAGRPLILFVRELQ